VIYAEIFLWLTHQKLDWLTNVWCNIRNWDGIAPVAPPGYEPAHTQSCFILQYFASWREGSVQLRSFCFAVLA